MSIPWSVMVALILGGTQPGCDPAKPARPPTPSSPHGSAAATQGSAEPSPGNVVQREMRMLTTILEATVRGIGARDVRPIEHELHRLHQAKDATTAALRDGSYQLPNHADQVDAFVAMDEAFHAHLGELVTASRANDVPRAADALGAIVRACEGCHAMFRAPVAPTP